MKATLCFFLAMVASTLGCSDWQTALNKHNVYRARHQAPALVWDDTLASQSAAWSATLVSSSGCTLQHSTSQQRGNAGENLYAAWGSGGASCLAATDGWYSEVANYIFSQTPWTTNSPNFGSIGHFSQLVWKSSVRLGCGSATGLNGNCWVITCRYSPPGNYIGDSSFLANVLPANNGPTPTPTPVPSPSPSPSPRPPRPSPSPPPPRLSPPPRASPSPPNNNPVPVVSSPPPAPASGCVDTHWACDWAVSNGYCNWYWSTGGQIKDNCRKSCNNCGRRLGETEEAAQQMSLARKGGVFRKAQEETAQETDEAKTVTVTQQSVFSSEGKGFAVGVPLTHAE